VLLEAESIPYEPMMLRGERLLVLAPHPDDEVIAAGGLIAQHLDEKRAVRVVVVTDGAQGGDATAREEETRRGLARLGQGAEIVFLGFPDRALGDEVIPPLREHLAGFRPDLILVPGPAEIHPDHLALSRAFCDLIQRDDLLFADLAVSKVAFYEVSQPLRPNALVDISAVAERKFDAIGEHASQLELRDYGGYAKGLNAYRAMTIAGCAYAEAYHVLELPRLRTMSFSAVRRVAAGPGEIEVVRETIPISVIIRTRDRPALLREAIGSVRASGYPCEIVVVNDGGGALDDLGRDVVSVRHEESRGRAEAANSGARAAGNDLITFLDDDDLHYPEHLATLAAATKLEHAGWYSDAVSVFLRMSESGGMEEESRLRLFAQDYDPDLLVLDNYIPLPTLLVRREMFQELGGFDPAFDLFEDWDFLIRLAQKGSLIRIPRVTCEIRHFAGGGSIVLAAPEGSERFRAAKLQVWEKHRGLLTPDRIATVFEQQKAKSATLYSGVVEARGEAEAARNAAERAWRETSDLRDQINGLMLRARELEGYILAKGEECQRQAAQIDELGAKRIDLEKHVQALEAETLRLDEELRRTHVEIVRLNGLLEMIYRSRTWKTHTFIERLRGRG
jgi:LmbE family N-acetylglucosaminyl deacetylase/GT2 family glycosyltransferase